MNMAGANNMDGIHANNNNSGDTDELADDLIKEAVSKYQEKALVPLIEDVAEWLTKVTGREVHPGDEFLDCLDDGVILCQLIGIIQTKQGSGSKERIRYKESASKGGWHARDNAATFIMWCKRFKIKQEILFESDGLVAHKQKREVVLCLLELTRFASRYGLEPPAIVKLEKEIEGDEMLLKRLDSGKGDLKKLKSNQSKTSNLDKEILSFTDQCKCDTKFYVEKYRDGIYALGNKKCLVRKFKGRHIMVRVGGGWDTLENYLACHDPCRITVFRKSAVQEDMLNVMTPEGGVMKKGFSNDTPSNENRFVHIRGRYSKGAGK